MLGNLHRASIGEYDWALSNDIIESYQVSENLGQKFASSMPSLTSHRKSICKKPALYDIVEHSEESAGDTLRINIEERGQWHSQVHILGRCVAIMNFEPPLTPHPVDSHAATEPVHWLKFRRDDIILVHCWYGNADLWFGSLATPSGLAPAPELNSECSGWFKQENVLILNGDIVVPYRIHLPLYYEFVEEEFEWAARLQTSYETVADSLRMAKILPTESFDAVFAGLRHVLTLERDMVAFLTSLARYYGQPCRWASIEQPDNFISQICQFFEALKPAVSQLLKHYVAQLPFVVRKVKALCREVPQLIDLLANLLPHTKPPVIALITLLYKPLSIVHRLPKFLSRFYEEQLSYTPANHPVIARLDSTVESWQLLLREYELQTDNMDNMQLVLHLESRLQDWCGEPLHLLGPFRMSSTVHVTVQSPLITARRAVRYYSMQLFSFKRSWRVKSLDLRENRSERPVRASPHVAYFLGSTLLLFKLDKQGENSPMICTYRIPPAKATEPLRVFRRKPKDLQLQVSWYDESNKLKSLTLQFETSALCSTWAKLLSDKFASDDLDGGLSSYELDPISRYDLLPCPSFSLDSKPACPTGSAASFPHSFSPVSRNSILSTSCTFSSAQETPSELVLDAKSKNRFSMGNPFDVNLPPLGSNDVPVKSAERLLEDSILQSGELYFGSVRKRPKNLI